jgi:hypothetical protein
MEQPDDTLEAIEFMVDRNIHGYNRKQIAIRVRPDIRGRDEEQKIKNAKAWLTKCLDPNSNQHFKPKDIDRICEVTGRADILINHLADNNGFERTARKVRLDAKNEVIILRQAFRENGLDPDEALDTYIKAHKDLFAVAFKKTRKR